MAYEQKIGLEPGASQERAGSSCTALLDRAGVEHIVKKLISERRERSSYLPSRLFADPAWDILLAVTLAEARHHRLSVSSLCGRVDVPATTALRWIKTLVDEGLLVRRDDVNDKRRAYVELSSAGYGTMVAHCLTTKTTWSPEA